MARLNQPASSDAESEEEASPLPRHPARSSETSPSPDPSSEKENEEHLRRNKRISAEMEDQTPGQSSKRRRTRGQSTQTPKKKFYDPNQDPGERRYVRRGLRNLMSRVQDEKSDLLKPDSNGLLKTFKEADKLYDNVKQTSEATLDSRLLVEAADLSYRKIKNLTLGDGSMELDVDDFITKCIIFMKQGNEPDRQNEPLRTQTQGRRPGQSNENDEEGDTLNWDYLGRNACFLYNSRPCLTGFLLGPLSVQKKVRQQTQRRAREARTQTQAVRPVQLGEEELNKQESANLTEICTEIASYLQNTQRKAEEACNNDIAELEERGAEPTDEEVTGIMRKHGIADNGQIPLFNFCVNPRSFGQSVENFFYVSFLIKEGKVGLDFDSRGLPTLGMVPPKSLEERQEAQRNQAVFTLDFDIWEDIIKTFEVEKSIIPHRIEEDYDDGTIDDARGDRQRPQMNDDGEDSDAYA
jgi:non-structural maintenance of chromosomes element 4